MNPSHAIGLGRGREREAPWSRKKRAALTFVIAAVLLGAASGLMAAGADASHFRYGNLNWQKSGPATGGTQPVTFQNEQSWRASAFGNPAVGSIIANGEGCINFGDSTSECPMYKVTFYNAAEDYIIMHALATGSTTDRNIPHTYATAGPFTATTSSCCTISTLNNANDASWQVNTLVDFTDDESAKSTVPPIVTLPEGGTQTYTIPAIDAGGETKRFRLTNATESCFGCANPHPPGLTIDPNTGQVSWDTTGRSGLWWTGVVVESLVAGNVVSSTQISYIIRIGAAGNDPPVWDDSVTPADGTVFTADPGETITFQLKATDPNSGDTVQIAQTSGPGTLNATDGNPATATYSYTAQASDIGNDQTIQFIAQDNGSPPLGPPFRSYTIHVEITNANPVCAGVTASPGTLWPPNHKFKLVSLGGATDPDGDPVTLTITGVTQDEPLNGLGDGDTSPDAWAGPSSSKVWVRAERAGARDGRVYQISFTGSDGQGGSCSGTAKVGVPLNQGAGKVPIDSGQTVNSFGP